MTLSTETAFVKPYFIEELDGEGLSSEDIARSLHTEHRTVVRALRRLSSMIPEMTLVGANSKTGARDKITYFLPTEEAKVLVARFENEIGLQYCRFLVKCEQVALRITPKLMAENADLKAQIVILQGMLGTKQKRLKKPKTGFHRSVVVDMFGEERMLAQRVPIETMTEAEQLSGRMYALVKQQEGLAAKVAALEEALAISNAKEKRKVEIERDCYKAVRPRPRQIKAPDRDDLH